MNKSDLVNHIAAQAGISKSAAEKALNAVTDGITTALKKGDTVTLVGFGTFLTAKRPPREGRNPTNGEKIKIPGRKVPRFKAGKALKDSVR